MSGQLVQGLNFNRAYRDGMSATQFMMLGLLKEAWERSLRVLPVGVESCTTKKCLS